MTPSLITGCIWMPLAVITALLPMRMQYVPGIGLLLLAPVLIIWIGLDYGWLVAVLAVAAFVSMFRNLLRYIYRRLKGEHPEIPQ